MTKIKANFASVLLVIGSLGIHYMGMLSSAHAAGLLTPVSSSANKIVSQSQHVTVMIEDGYVVTQVDQVFHNPNPQQTQAIYSFPVPEKGTVSEFTLWIEGKPVTGEVLAKKKARQIYEEERAAGRETALSEKHQHYRFENRVSIAANSDQKIRFVYMQAVDMTSSMGRYVYPLEEGGTDDKALSFWTMDKTVEDFSFKMNLRSSYPVDAIRLPAHPQAIVSQQSAEEWKVVLASDQATHVTTPAANQQGSHLSHDDDMVINNQQIIDNKDPTQPATSVNHVVLDKDIVVYWRLAQNLPGSVDMVTYREAGKKRGTYMLTVTPGDDLSKITEGRDWAFVLDMSGSMSGKYSTLVEGVQRALQSLNTEDRFRLIRFSSGVSEVTSGWVSATDNNIRHWSDMLAKAQVGGSTNLYAGLKRGLDVLDADRTGVIVLVTDGEANVGVTEKKKFLKLMEGQDVRLFTAVMGNGANRPLLNSMAEVSHGFAVSVSNSDDIAGKLLEFTSKVNHQAFHDAELNISGIKTSDQTPEKPVTLYRGEQMVIFGHYWGSGEAKVSLEGKISGVKKVYKTAFEFPEQSTNNPEIERLWAYAQIRHLQNTIDYLGEEGDYKDAIVDLAVDHGLVTDYTSMIVMRDEQFEKRGIKRHNRDRVQVEKVAANHRLTAPVSQTRVDTHQPMFKASRSSYSSGGGAFEPELLWLLPLLMLIQLRRRMK